MHAHTGACADRNIDYQMHIHILIHAFIQQRSYSHSHLHSHSYLHSYPHLHCAHSHCQIAHSLTFLSSSHRAQTRHSMNSAPLPTLARLALRATSHSTSTKWYTRNQQIYDVMEQLCFLCALLCAQYCEHLTIKNNEVVCTAVFYSNNYIQ